MSAHTLRNLIIASGNSGSTGQSFRNHVAGPPATGTKMSDYFVTGWSFSNGVPNGEPPPIEEQTGYPSGHTFNTQFTFSEGNMAQYIRRKGSGVITSSMGGGSGGSGSGVSISASSVTTSSTGTVDFTITSRFNPLAQIDLIRSYFTDLGPGSDPLDEPDGPGEVTFDASTQTGAGSGQETIIIALHYEVDIGGFNEPLDKQYEVLMNDRAALTTEFQVEWSSTGTEATGTPGDLGESYDITVMQDAQGEDITVWYRYRFWGETLWVNGNSGGWHVATFTDPRLAA